jgi:hypothetical protein
VRQAALRSAIGVVDVLPNVRSGFGRSFEPPGLLTWFSLSPWQFVQVGVRPSAVVPWRVCPIARSWGESSASWQRVHRASPVLLGEGYLSAQQGGAARERGGDRMAETHGLPLCRNCSTIAPNGRCGAGPESFLSVSARYAVSPRAVRAA